MIKKIIVIVYVILIPHVLFAATDGIYNITVDNVGFASGSGTDGSYSIGDTIGESIVGQSSDGMYQKQDGFWYALNTILRLTVDSNTIDLGDINAGVAGTGETTITVTTDAPSGYNLLISQDHDMVHENHENEKINAYSGTIDAPTVWQNNSIGLGFTVLSATNKEVKWGTDTTRYYAGIPDVSTLFHKRTEFSPIPDETKTQYKVNVATTQRSGVYNNQITYTVFTAL